MKFIVEVELAGAPVVDKVDQPNPEVELADAPVVDKVEQPTHFNPDGPVFGATVQGQEITNVVPDSPAANAGLKVGDKILTFNGQKIVDARDYDKAVDVSPLDAELTVLKKATGDEENVVLRLNKTVDVNGPVFGATVQGQKIINVVPNSPAALAGLKVGDKILVFNGENVDDAQDFSDAVDKAAADSWLRVLGQDGQFRDVLINLNKK
jgi:membrane-associated protease RseP (regulator of RpoE activity)